MADGRAISNIQLTGAHWDNLAAICWEHKEFVDNGLICI